jgi:hypothetical protein
MAKCKRMDQIKSILKNYLLSGSIKATARQLNMSKNTVREYVRRALAYNSNLEDLLEMEEEELQNIFYAKEKNNERLADYNTPTNLDRELS